MCWAGFFPVTPLPYEIRTLRSHWSLSGDLLNYWCCHLMRGVGVCVCTGNTLFIKRFGMNTVKEKPKKQQWKMQVLGTRSMHPWPGLVLGCKWSPVPQLLLRRSPWMEKGSRASGSVQKKRPSTGLTLASLWWLLKQTELHSSQPVLVWHSPRGGV